jgi:hypothetical protein
MVGLAIQFGVSLRELRLASVFESLELAGIDIHTTGRKGCWRVLRVNDLKEIEADGYAEESDPDDEWTGPESGTDYDDDMYGYDEEWEDYDFVYSCGYPEGDI